MLLQATFEGSKEGGCTASTKAIAEISGANNGNLLNLALACRSRGADRHRMVDHILVQTPMRFRAYFHCDAMTAVGPSLTNHEMLPGCPELGKKQTRIRSAFMGFDPNSRGSPYFDESLPSRSNALSYCAPDTFLKRCAPASAPIGGATWNGCATSLYCFPTFDKAVSKSEIISHRHWPFPGVRTLMPPSQKVSQPQFISRA